MQSKLGRRVILESGPITNVLAALGLLDQMRIANICKRTHSTTVPQFEACLWFPTEAVCDFPNIKISSASHVIKRIKVAIEGCSGVFYGVVEKSNDLPDGLGIFVALNGWVHFGRVKDSCFHESRMISVNKEAQVLQLINKKLLDDGSVLKKMQ